MNLLVEVVQLFVLFFVIIEPFVSFSIFVAATERMKPKERHQTANLAIFVAALLSLLVLIFGEALLTLFHTTVDDLRVAGGIVIGLLGIKMAMGKSVTDISTIKNSGSKAIAAIIGTPLLTGPATITAIIVATQDFGTAVTGIAIFLVLAFTSFIFYFSDFFKKIMGQTTLQIISTVFGLITLSWAVQFIKTGLGF